MKSFHSELSQKLQDENDQIEVLIGKQIKIKNQIKNYVYLKKVKNDEERK